MTCLLTLSGLRQLWELRKTGQEVPRDWFEDAKSYLRIKRQAVESFSRAWDKEQLREAETIIQFLIQYRGDMK